MEAPRSIPARFAKPWLTYRRYLQICVSPDLAKQEGL